MPMVRRSPSMPPGKELAVFPSSEVSRFVADDLPSPANILTVPHSGTFSLVTCYERLGVPINRAVAFPPVEVEWLHWFEPRPRNFLSGVVVSTLRHPVWCLLSSHGRDQAIWIEEPPTYAVDHLEAWTQFAANVRRVDLFVPVDELPVRENVTGDPVGAKQRYKDTGELPPELVAPLAAIMPFAQAVYDGAGIVMPEPR